jgi:hypothetical protein
VNLAGAITNAISYVTHDSQSVAALNANFSVFMDEYLGKPIEDYGKLPVMAMSNYGRTPKFNKYPGVIEWNNCLFLWVNIGGKSGYTNTFSEHGRYMMWYGGSKMKSGLCMFNCFLYEWLTNVVRLSSYFETN